MPTSSRSKKTFFTRIKHQFREQPLRSGIIAGLLALIALGVIGLAYFAVIAAQLPNEDQISNIQIPNSTKIYDRTGEVLLYDLAQDQKRTIVPIESIPDVMKYATIDIEDQRFYSEASGIDIKAIIRALAVDLIHGSIVQGGSTITQQVAKNTFLSPKQTITRKLQEILLAIKINHYYSKDKILELYLNQSPYGPTMYGVETASEDYFGKPVTEVTVAQAALLAALPKAPSRFSPYGTHTDELFARQRTVLQKMKDNGHIDQQQLDEALKEHITFEPLYRGMKAPHFVTMVEEYLAQKYGDETVQKGNLKVITTLDWELQQKAEKAVADGVERNTKLYKGTNGALVAEDPKTGQILAMVGSADYFDLENQGNFNVATQGLRQPGSATKPFVYLSAFEKGYTPATTIFDVPTEFTAGDPVNCPAIPNFSVSSPGCFHPQNFEGTFLGPVSMTTGLAESMNVVAVKVLYLTGVKDAITLMNSFGLSTLTDSARYGLSLVLGGGEVRLVDMVKAYSVLSQEGTLHDQASVLEVRDATGQVLEKYQDNIHPVVDPQYPRMINKILDNAAARAPLFQASQGLTVFPGYDVALKTGTTNDYRDAWAMGYTPNLVVGVWAGNNNNKPMVKSGSSILAAVPMWSAFMKEALPHFTAETFADAGIPTTGKPVLDGASAVDGQVHSILYYVNRNDPLGPPPSNPSSDPQFNNWEYAVQTWAGNNPLPIDGEPGTGSSTTSTSVLPGAPVRIGI